MMAALSVFTVTSVQADTGKPDILSSISSGSVQTLSKTESSEIRGEYRYCTTNASPFAYCGTTFSRDEPFGNEHINIVWKYQIPGLSVWVSR